VFFTSDSAFCHLLGTLQRRGKRVTVVSTLKNNGATVADELRRQADQFIDLVDLATDVGRFPRSKSEDRTPQTRRSDYVDPDLDVDADN
jgi:uncharacterized LabA/DUF88 family protein